MYVHGSDNKRKIMPLVVPLQAVCLKDLQSQFVSHTVGLDLVDAWWQEATILLIFFKQCPFPFIYDETFDFC